MLKPDKILYEAEVTATGGRDGKAASDDGLLSVVKVWTTAPVNVLVVQNAEISSTASEPR